LKRAGRQTKPTNVDGYKTQNEPRIAGISRQIPKRGFNSLR
jgi:hypothetical protein